MCACVPDNHRAQVFPRRDQRVCVCVCACVPDNRAQVFPRRDQRVSVCVCARACVPDNHRAQVRYQNALRASDAGCCRQARPGLTDRAQPLSWLTARWLAGSGVSVRHSVCADWRNGDDGLHSPPLSFRGLLARRSGPL